MLRLFLFLLFIIWFGWLFVCWLLACFGSLFFTLPCSLFTYSFVYPLSSFFALSLNSFSYLSKHRPYSSFYSFISIFFHTSPLSLSLSLFLSFIMPRLSFIFRFLCPLIHSPHTLPGVSFPPPLLFFYLYPFLTFLIFNLFLPGFHELYYSCSFSLILPILFLLNPFILSLSFRVFLLTSFHPSFHCQSFLLSNLLLKPNHCPPLPCTVFCLSCTRPSFLHPFLSLPSAPPLPFAPLCPK